VNPQRAKQRQPANEFGSGEAPWPAHWIKLQYDTSIETFLTCATIAGLFLAAALFLDTRTTTRLGISRTPLRPLAPYALTVGLLALGARLATDNFALVDPDRHELYAHVRFLWFRRIRRVLAAGEAAAVTATGRKCWTMWSSW
jgi:predicted permease